MALFCLAWTDRKLLQLPTASEVPETAPKSTARSVLPETYWVRSPVEEGEPGKTVTGQAQPHRKHEILRYDQKANDLAKTQEERLKVAKDLGGKMKKCVSQGTPGLERYSIPQSDDQDW
jgi:hypothetical protein